MTMRETENKNKGNNNEGRESQLQTENEMSCENAWKGNHRTWPGRSLVFPLLLLFLSVVILSFLPIFLTSISCKPKHLNLVSLLYSFSIPSRSSDAWSTNSFSTEIGSASNQIFITDLKPLTSYSLRVFAVNSMGESEASSILNIKTEEEGKEIIEEKSGLECSSSLKDSLRTHSLFVLKEDPSVSKTMLFSLLFSLYYLFVFYEQLQELLLWVFESSPSVQSLSESNGR